ncbi:MAG: prefoldin subunit beta [Candidatus Methanomethylophilaceae archaeon]
MNNISPQLQNQIAQFQQVQQQLQATSSQKLQMEAQRKEMERTLAELEKASGDIYRNVGSLMIKVEDKTAVRTEITDAMETMEVRIKSMDRQEKSLRDKFESLQESINKEMGQK